MVYVFIRAYMACMLSVLRRSRTPSGVKKMADFSGYTHSTENESGGKRIPVRQINNRTTPRAILLYIRATIYHVFGHTLHLYVHVCCVPSV